MKTTANVAVMQSFVARLTQIALVHTLLPPSFAASAESTLTVRSRSELISAAERAVAGATIRLAPGEYRGGIRFSQLKGKAGKPIVITALDQQRRPIIEGGASGIHLSGCQHVELRC